MESRPDKSFLQDFFVKSFVASKNSPMHIQESDNLAGNHGPAANELQRYYSGYGKVCIFQIN